MAPGLGGIGTNSLEKSFLSLPMKLLLNSPSVSSTVLLAAKGEGTTHDVRSRERLPLLSPPAPMLLRRPLGLLAGLSIALQTFHLIGENTFTKIV